MTLFSHSLDIQGIIHQAKAGAAEGLYEPSQRRLRVPLSMVMLQLKFMVKSICLKQLKRLKVMKKIMTL